MFIVMIRTSLLEKSNDGATPRHLIIITSRQYFGAVMYGGEGNSVSIIIIEYPDISRGKKDSSSKNGFIWERETNPV